jgi:hypothetical protein
MLGQMPYRGNGRLGSHPQTPEFGLSLSLEGNLGSRARYCPTVPLYHCFAFAIGGGGDAFQRINIRTF